MVLGAPTRVEAWSLEREGSEVAVLLEPPQYLPVADGYWSAIGSLRGIIICVHFSDRALVRVCAEAGAYEQGRALVLLEIERRHQDSSSFTRSVRRRAVSVGDEHHATQRP